MSFRLSAPVATVAAVAVLFLAAACEDDVMTPGEEADPVDATRGVAVVDNAFEPDDIDVDEGATVRFIHEGDNVHTITINGVNQSGDFNPGDEPFAFAFDRVGEHSVTCDYHPEMNLSVTVTGPID